MSELTIQELFDEYLKLLGDVHNIDQEVDGLINEVEIGDLQQKRTYLKSRLKRILDQLVQSLKRMGSTYPIHNYLANRTTYLSVETDKLRIDYR